MEVQKNLFNSVARPLFMYVCALGFFIAFVIDPIMQYIGFEKIELPIDPMMELTLAMLGLATLRTVEKIKGVSK